MEKDRDAWPWSEEPSESAIGAVLALIFQEILPRQTEATKQQPPPSAGGGND